MRRGTTAAALIPIFPVLQSEITEYQHLQSEIKISQEESLESFQPPLPDNPQATARDSFWGRPPRGHRGIVEADAWLAAWPRKPP